MFFFFFFFFRFFVGLFCCSGWVAFRLFGFCSFYVGFCGFYVVHSQFLCGFMRLLQLWRFASSALPVPLLVAFGGFLALAFRPVGFSASSLVPPAITFSIIMGGAAAPPYPPAAFLYISIIMGLFFGPELNHHFFNHHAPPPPKSQGPRFAGDAGDVGWTCGGC